MHTVKSCGEAHSHCKICRPDLADVARSASLLPSARVRSRASGKRGAREAQRRRGAPKPCSIMGCDKKHLSRGWCPFHYWCWYNHGTPLYKRLTRLCSIEGCEKKHSAHGYCIMHLTRVEKYGSYELPIPVRSSRKCSLDGCEQPHLAKDFCKSHYGTLITSPQRRALKRGSKSRLKPKQWLMKVKEYDNRCAYCGAQSDKLTQDHIIPLSKGGHHTLANVVPACWSCNRLKGYSVNKYIPMSPSVISDCFSLAP